MTYVMYAGGLMGPPAYLRKVDIAENP